MRSKLGVKVMRQKFLRQSIGWMFVFISLSGQVWAQKVFSVQYASQADVKVFVVDYESQADLKVYKVDYASQAGQDGRWFFTDYASQADKKVFFVNYASQADLKIFYVKYQSQAGWRDRSKSHLLR